MKGTMRPRHRPAVVALVLTLSAVALADSTSQVLVLTTPTRVPATPQGTSTGSLWLQNGGSNTIYCAPSSTVTVNTGFSILAGEKQPLPNSAAVYCIAAVAQTGVGRDHTLTWVTDQ